MDYVSVYIRKHKYKYVWFEVYVIQCFQYVTELRRKRLLSQFLIANFQLQHCAYFDPQIIDVQWHIS